MQFYKYTIESDSDRVDEGTNVMSGYTVAHDFLRSTEVVERFLEGSLRRLTLEFEVPDEDFLGRKVSDDVPGITVIFEALEWEEACRLWDEIQERRKKEREKQAEQIKHVFGNAFGLTIEMEDN